MLARVLSVLWVWVKRYNYQRWTFKFERVKEIKRNRPNYMVKLEKIEKKKKQQVKYKNKRSVRRTMI